MSYKLSTVLLNIERFKNDNPGLWIDTDGNGDFNTLNSILNYIFKTPNWEVLEQFDYSPSDLKMIISGFKALRSPHFENKTPVWNEFVTGVLQENMEALETTGKSVTQRAMQVANQQQVSDRFDPSNDVVAYMEFKNNDFMTGYHQVMFAVEGEKDVYNYLDDIKAYILTQSRNEQITGEQTTALLKWAFEGFVQQVVFGTTEPDFNEIQNFTYNLEVSDAKAYLTSMDVNFANFLEEIGFFNYSDTGNDDPDAEIIDYDPVLLTDEYSDDLTEYHNVMLDEPENAIEFVLNIVGFFNDLRIEKSWDNKQFFNEVKYGLSNVVTDRIFTKSTGETDEMYDTPNYNLSKTEFFNMLKLHIENENSIFEFDVEDLLAEIFDHDLDSTRHGNDEDQLKSEILNYLDVVIKNNTNKDIYYWGCSEGQYDKLYKINSIDDINPIQLPHEHYAQTKPNGYEGYETTWHMLFVIEGYDFEIFEFNVNVENENKSYSVAPWDKSTYTYEPDNDDFVETEGYTDERALLNQGGWIIADQLREILNEDPSTDEDFEFNKGLKEWLTNNIATDYQLDPDDENYHGFLNTGIGMMDGYDEYFTALSNDPDYWNEWMRNNLNLEMSTYSHPEEIIFDRIENNIKIIEVVPGYVEVQLSNGVIVEYNHNGFNPENGAIGVYTTSKHDKPGTPEYGDVEFAANIFNKTCEMDETQESFKFLSEGLKYILNNLSLEKLKEAFFYEEEDEDEVDETFVSIEIMPDADVSEVLERSAPKYGVNYVTGDGEIFLQGPYEKVKYFIKTEYDRNFDFSDFYDKYEKNWKVSSLEITSQELHDSGEYISGYFNFVCDNDYTSAGFTYYADDDTPTEIDELDSNYEDEFEKGGEFHNELINFIEDNVDTDLFDEDESLTYKVEEHDVNQFEVTISEDDEPIYSCIFDYSEMLMLVTVDALDGESGEIEPEDFDKDMEAKCMDAIQTYIEENNWERTEEDENEGELVETRILYPAMNTLTKTDFDTSKFTEFFNDIESNGVIWSEVEKYDAHHNPNENASHHTELDDLINDLNERGSGDEMDLIYLNFFIDNNVRLFKVNINQYFLDVIHDYFQEYSAEASINDSKFKKVSILEKLREFKDTSTDDNFFINMTYPKIDGQFVGTITKENLLTWLVELNNENSGVDDSFVTTNNIEFGGKSTFDKETFFHRLMIEATNDEEDSNTYQVFIEISELDEGTFIEPIQMMMYLNADSHSLMESLVEDTIEDIDEDNSNSTNNEFIITNVDEEGGVITLDIDGTGVYYNYDSFNDETSEITVYINSDQDEHAFNDYGLGANIDAKTVEEGNGKDPIQQVLINGLQFILDNTETEILKNTYYKDDADEEEEEDDIFGGDDEIGLIEAKEHLMSKITNERDFPNPLICFYYPYNHSKSEFNYPINKLTTLFNEIFENENIYGDFVLLKSLDIDTDVASEDIGDLLTTAMENIPGSDLENDEEVIYMSLPYMETYIKINVAAETWNLFWDTFGTEND